jgi:hypothetical protein
MSCGCRQARFNGSGALTAKVAEEIPNDEKKPATERPSGALHVMLEAARGLPDLLKARREAMEARWRG